MTVTIYTDGGCDPNPGIGGWGVVLIFGDARKELSGGERDTTNNRMELTAAIRALEALSRPCAIQFFTDSQYVKNGITQWLPNWKKKNWKRKTGSVKNLDLWKQLDALRDKHEIKWEWIPSHIGIEENDRCDELATEEIRKLKRSG